MMNLINQDILQEVESKKGLNITLQKTWENFIRQVNNEFCAGYKDRYSVQKVDFFMEDSNYSKDYLYIRFRIEQRPEWMFGIECAKKSIENTYIDFTFRFWGQYWDVVDKFKYSRAKYRDESTLRIFTEEDTEFSYEETIDIGGVYTICRIIDFIIKEPEMAFCRDYYGWDYNLELHTKISAINRYNKWRKEFMAENSAKEICRVKLLHFIKNEVMPFYPEDAFIVDKGDNVRPRYDICVYDEKCTGTNFGIYLLKKEEKEVHRKYKVFLRECKQVFKEHKVSFVDYMDLPNDESSFECCYIITKELKKLVKYKKIDDNGVELYVVDVEEI